MKIEYGIHKSIKNEKERGLPFSKVKYFEWETAIAKQDERKDYPETRFVASGFINGRLYILCFAPIKNGIRVISFKKSKQKRGQQL